MEMLNEIDVFLGRQRFVYGKDNTKSQKELGEISDPPWGVRGLQREFGGFIENDRFYLENGGGPRSARTTIIFIRIQ